MKRLKAKAIAMASRVKNAISNNKAEGFVDSGGASVRA